MSTTIVNQYRKEIAVVALPENRPTVVYQHRKEITVVPTADNRTTIVSFVGLQGPKGENGDAGTATGKFTYYSFSFGDSTPATIATVPSGKRVLKASILVDIAFDGAGSAIRIGDVGDSESVMLATDSDPSSVGTYESSPGISWGGDTDILLNITPGSGASQGSGVISLLIES